LVEKIQAMEKKSERCKGKPNEGEVKKKSERSERPFAGTKRLSAHGHRRQRKRSAGREQLFLKEKGRGKEIPKGE